MSLLKELLAEARRSRVKHVAKPQDEPVMGEKPRNFVAKHSHNMTGAGRHEDKNGKKASRNRQKKEWKRDSRDEY